MGLLSCPSRPRANSKTQSQAGGPFPGAAPSFSSRVGSQKKKNRCGGSGFGNALNFQPAQNESSITSHYISAFHLLLFFLHNRTSRGNGEECADRGSSGASRQGQRLTPQPVEGRLRFLRDPPCAHCLGVKGMRCCCLFRGKQA